MAFRLGARAGDLSAHLREALVATMVVAITGGLVATVAILTTWGVVSSWGGARSTEDERE